MEPDYGLIQGSRGGRGQRWVETRPLPAQGLGQTDEGGGSVGTWLGSLSRTQ